ncbi:MAG: transposase [Magnetococcales bacterium]|nr:transposase [Magnetococcales bacterium]
MRHPVGLFTFKSSGIDSSADLEDRLDFLTLFMEKGSGGDPLDRLPDRSRRYLQETWPHFFRTQVLGMAPDGVGASNGFSQERSNDVSMILLLSLSVLKEFLELTDEELEQAVRFDLRFHYALGLDLDETDLSLRALYRFREQVVSSSEAVLIFDTVADRIIGQLGPEMGRSGLDAKGMRFNMKMQMRLGGLVGSIEAFLDALEAECPVGFNALPALISERYRRRSGAFANVRPGQCRRQLDLVLNDADMLTTRFAEDVAINRFQSFKTLRRMQGEQSGLQVGFLLPDSFLGSGLTDIMIMSGRA